MATEEGWLYLGAIKDLLAGESVGRSFGARMTTELVVRAFEQAVSAHRPAPGLIHHSDRGSQYCSHEYQKLLASYGMRVSMSRKGNCYDNAPIESFWGTLKTELVHHRRYRTRAEAAREIREYIDLFYNRQRRQAPPGVLVTGRLRATVHAAASRMNITWRKLHLGVDEATGEFVAVMVTTNDFKDSQLLLDLLAQVEDEISQVSADGAYDSRNCYHALRERKARAAIAPRRGARIWQHANTRSERHIRDENLREIRRKGRRE